MSKETPFPLEARQNVITPDIETLACELEMGARSTKSVMRKLGISDVERMMKEIQEEKDGEV